MSRIKKIQKELDKRRGQSGWHPFYFEAMNKTVTAYIALSKIPADAPPAKVKEMCDAAIEEYVKAK